MNTTPDDEIYTKKEIKEINKKIDRFLAKRFNCKTSQVDANIKRLIEELAN